MKKYIAMTLCCLMIFAVSAASACGSYVLIYDSDTRLLSEREVRGYHYETLGIVLHEILARHGYHFDEDGRYYDHFMSIDYIDPHDTGFPYEEAPEDISNEEIIAGLSRTEFKNIALIKKIREEKRNTGDESGFYADWGCYETPDELHFTTVGNAGGFLFPLNLLIPVYSGPGTNFLRGANGKAMVSTNEEIDVYGYEGDWMMIAYLVNSDPKQTRVGYIHKNEFGRPFGCQACTEYKQENPYSCNYCSNSYIKPLTFAYTPAVLTADSVLTDDPTGIQSPLAQIKAGDTVTVLMPTEEPEEGSDWNEWAYVEYTGGRQPMRGFIPMDALR